MRKSYLCLVLVWILFLSIFVSPVRAEEEELPANSQWENAVDIKNSEATDSLPTEESVRWYRFTLENISQAVVCLTSEEDDEWDGSQIVKHCWSVEVYCLTDDEDNPLKKRKSEPFGGHGGRTQLLFEGLEPGEYFIRVEPYHERGCGLTYTVSVITEGYTYPAGSVQRTTISKASEIITVMGGRVFIKENDGEAYIACYVDEEHNNLSVILLSEWKDAVFFYTAKKSSYPIEDFVYDHNKYYYTVLSAGSADEVTPDPTLYLCCNGDPVDAETAANDLFKLHFGTSPKEEAEKEAQRKDRIGTIAAYVVIGIIVVIGVFELIMFTGIGDAFKSSKRYRSSGSSRSSGSYRSSGSSRSSGSYGRSPTERDVANMVDDAIAAGIAERSHTPGYDPDGFSKGPGPEDFDPNPDAPTGPGPEDFPPSGAIW